MVFTAQYNSDSNQLIIAYWTMGDCSGISRTKVQQQCKIWSGKCWIRMAAEIISSHYESVTAQQWKYGIRCKWQM